MKNNSCKLVFVCALAMPSTALAAGHDVDGDGRSDLVVMDAGLQSGKARFRMVRLGDSGALKSDQDAKHRAAEIVGVADVDGDGRSDLILQWDDGGTRRWAVRRNPTAGYGKDRVWTETRTRNVSVIGMADVNGDRKWDLVLQYDHKGTRRWQARRSDGETFEYNRDWTSMPGRVGLPLGLADVDGDGRADLVIEYEQNGRRRWQARISSGARFNGDADWADSPRRGLRAVGLADVNGDAKADLVLQYDHKGTRRWQARLSDGGSFQSSNDWASLRLDRNARNPAAVGLADADGDGKADLIVELDNAKGARQWKVYLSDGERFVASRRPWWEDSRGEASGIDLIDGNGDGKADLLLEIPRGANGRAHQVSVVYSSGKRFEKPRNYLSNADKGWRPFVGAWRLPAVPQPANAPVVNAQIAQNTQVQVAAPAAPAPPDCKKLVIKHGFLPMDMGACDGVEPFCAAKVLERGFHPMNLSYCKPELPPACTTAVLDKEFHPMTVGYCEGVKADCAKTVLDAGNHPMQLSNCR